MLVFSFDFGGWPSVAKFTSTSSGVSALGAAEDPMSILHLVQIASLWTTPRLVPWTERSPAVC